MTSEALYLLANMLSQAWRLFTSWHFPGTNVSPAAWALFGIVAGLSIKFINTFVLGTHVLSSLKGNPNKRGSKGDDSDS